MGDVRRDDLEDDGVAELLAECGGFFGCRGDLGSGDRDADFVEDLLGLDFGEDGAALAAGVVDDLRQGHGVEFEGRLEADAVVRRFSRAGHGATRAVVGEAAGCAAILAAGVAGFAVRGFDLPVVGTGTDARKVQVDTQFGSLLDQGAPPSTAAPIWARLRLYEHDRVEAD